MTQGASAPFFYNAYDCVDYATFIAFQYMMKNMNSLLIAVAVALGGMVFAQETNAAPECNAPATCKQAEPGKDAWNKAKRGCDARHGHSAVFRKHGKAFRYGKQGKCGGNRAKRHFKRHFRCKCHA